MQMLSSPSSWSCFVASLPALSLLLFCDTFFISVTELLKRERKEKRGACVGVCFDVCALLPMCCYSVPNSKCKVNKLFYSHFKSPALSLSLSLSLSLCSIFSVPLALLFFVCDASVPLPLLPLLLLPPFHSALIHLARISCPLFFLPFFILFFFFLIFCRLLMMTTVEDSQCDTEISESVDSFFEHYFLLLKKNVSFLNSLFSSSGH